MDEKQWLVLIVEDDPDVREVLQVVLKLKYGCQVAIVNDGEAAIAYTRHESPDLILMDLVLPVMNGFEATRRLTIDPTTVKIPIIAISDHAWDESVQRQAILAGCRMCINKADLFADMHKTIHHILKTYLPDFPQ